MSKTVVGLFSTVAQAEQVKQALVSEGFEANHIKVVANDNNDATTTDKDYTDIGSGGGTGIGEKISGFFSNLTGGDEHAHNHYATGVNAGGALLTATVADEEAEDVAEILKAHGARDIEGGYQGSASAGVPVYGESSAATTGATSIPVVEEELVVGKREVDRGGVRIYSHLVERPVEEDVTLREEHINVERRPVNRPATAADFEVGRGGVIELNATGEEAVVGKTSRVVEEISVGKTSTEAIHDTVRKTEVDVEQIPGETVSKDRY
jgi:uncharacterized protein (TIGR02271 family)